MSSQLLICQPIFCFGSFIILIVYISLVLIIDIIYLMMPSSMLSAFAEPDERDRSAD